VGLGSDPKNLAADVFKENGLGGMLTCRFNGSPYEAINFAYPGIFKPWELKNVPRNFWNIDTAVESTRWMVEKKLGMTADSAKNITRSHFVECGLAGMLTVMYRHDFKEALRAAYPDKEF